MTRATAILRKPPAAPGPGHDVRTKHRGDVHVGTFLNASYGVGRAQQQLERKGYRRDDALSSHNQSVYVNGRTKRAVVAVAGTHNLSDAATDVRFALGGLKDTGRYREARDVAQATRDKYQGYTTSTVGHSLGGAVAAGVARPNELAVTYNRAATVGSTIRPNEAAFRQAGDAVSVLASGEHNMTTLHTALTNMVLPVFGPHNVSNLENQPLYL